MSAFEIGETYSRIEISKIIGGSTRDYMPIVQGAVVCICLTMEMNPEAPDIVLVGKGPKVESAAKMFSRQSWLIPLFIKRHENAWEYIGDFRAKFVEQDSNEIAARGAKAGRLDVVSVLYLQSE